MPTVQMDLRSHQNNLMSTTLPTLLVDNKGNPNPEVVAVERVNFMSFHEKQRDDFTLRESETLIQNAQITERENGQE